MNSRFRGLLAIVFVMTCLDFPVFAQETGKLENQITFSRVEKDSFKLAWADLLVPDSFQQAGWKNPLLDSSLTTGRSLVVIPIQFKEVREITVEEQQLILIEKENETIYKQQSDPHYFEKMEERFRLEFNQRMKARGDQ